MIRGIDSENECVLQTLYFLRSIFFLPSAKVDPKLLVYVHMEVLLSEYGGSNPRLFLDKPNGRSSKANCILPSRFTTKKKTARKAATKTDGRDEQRPPSSGGGGGATARSTRRFKKGIWYGLEDLTAQEGA